MVNGSYTIGMVEPVGAYSVNVMNASSELVGLINLERYSLTMFYIYLAEQNGQDR
jgi:hypothetical protein